MFSSKIQKMLALFLLIYFVYAFTLILYSCINYIILYTHIYYIIYIYTYITYIYIFRIYYIIFYYITIFCPCVSSLCRINTYFLSYNPVISAIQPMINIIGFHVISYLASCETPFHCTSFSFCGLYIFCIPFTLLSYFCSHRYWRKIMPPLMKVFL